MAWWAILLLFFGLFLLFVIIGMPIAFSFLISNLILITVLMGFNVGADQLVQKMVSAVTSFSLTPIPLFILMGELLFQSGIILTTLNFFNKLTKKLPGRLSVLAIVSGTVFSSLSGSSIANTAMLGSLLGPEMEKRGYHSLMSIGPIMGAGSLAMIIPPSGMAVLLGGTASISVGALLLGGILPGIILALMFIIYIIVACLINPSLAPELKDEHNTPVKDDTNLLTVFLLDTLPLLFIVFSVIGFIFLGIATPTEAAAIGCAASIIVILAKRKLTTDVVRKSFIGTMKINGMIMLIVSTSIGFSQLLAFTGASRDMIGFVDTLNLSKTAIVITLLFIVIFLGLFIEPISVMMITVPVFIPILTMLDVDMIWFGIMMLICLDLGNITPPVGLLLYVMKGARPNVPMSAIYMSALPIVFIEVLIVVILLIFPETVLFIPSIGGS